MSYKQTLSAQILERSPNLKEKIKNLDTYARLRSKLRTIELENSTFYIAEGDMLLDEDELMIYAMEEDMKEVNNVLGNHANDIYENALLGIINAGKIVRWAPNTELTYCVLKDTFANEREYKIVLKNMLKATKSWEEVCGIKFKHLRKMDTSKSDRPNGVMFPVRGINASGKFIASAFFPTYPKYRWRILIDPTYFTSSYSKTGVLVHELGHVMGFRHEHPRNGAPATCPNEDLGNTIELTDYDPKSVMHYFCGGVGSKTLYLSELDKKGAQKIYGPPLNQFDFVS